MPSDVPPLPSDLRYVLLHRIAHTTNSSVSHGNAMYLTIDGNHHANRYVKNSDLRDESLLLGQSYFPEKNSYREYLAQTTVTKEVSLLVAYDYTPLIQNSLEVAMQLDQCGEHARPKEVHW